MTKKLFEVSVECLDGITRKEYTMNENFIKSIEMDYKAGLLDSDSGLLTNGIFCYKTVEVDSKSTLESLGIEYDLAEDYVTSESVH